MDGLTKETQRKDLLKLELKEREYSWFVLNNKEKTKTFEFPLEENYWIECLKKRFNIEVDSDKLAKDIYIRLQPYGLNDGSKIAKFAKNLIRNHETYILLKILELIVNKWEKHYDKLLLVITKFAEAIISYSDIRFYPFLFKITKDFIVGNDETICSTYKCLLKIKSDEILKNVHDTVDEYGHVFNRYIFMF